MADLEDVLNSPPEDLKAQILKDLREDEGRLDHNLKLLELWMSCQTHLPKNYDKKLLINFLRGCKHDLQCTKKRLEQYFIIRSLEEGLFGNRVMTLQRDLMIPKYGGLCPMPELTPEGYRLTLRTVISKDDYTVNVLQFLRYELMICEIRMHYETLWAGDVFVFDARSLCASMAMNALCTDFWKTVDLTQNTLPIRVKQVHIITGHSMMVKLANLIKQVLSDKLAKRIYIHPNLESVFKVIPQRLFPLDWGGEKKSILEIMNQWNKKFVELEEWFQKLEDLKVSGPIPKAFEQTFFDVYGVEGSFRKINID